MREISALNCFTVGDVKTWISIEVKEKLGNLVDAGSKQVKFSKFDRCVSLIINRGLLAICICASENPTLKIPHIVSRRRKNNKASVMYGVILRYFR